jgi:hypothetical protein
MPVWSLGGRPVLGGLTPFPLRAQTGKGKTTQFKRLYYLLKMLKNKPMYALSSQYPPLSPSFFFWVGGSKVSILITSQHSLKTVSLCSIC